jgi:hypothetical protein
VLGVVVAVVVEGAGAGAVVVGLGAPASSLPGIGGGDDCGAADGALTTSEASALEGGGAPGALAVDDAGAATGALGCVVFGRGLDASPVPFVACISANTLTNPTANARMHAPTSATRRLCIPVRFAPTPPSTTGGLLSSTGNDWRTVAGETGTLEAFRNARAAKRRRSTADGALELPLAHLGAALDVLLARLLVELVTGPSAGPPVRPDPAAAAG